MEVNKLEICIYLTHIFNRSIKRWAFKVPLKFQAGPALITELGAKMYAVKSNVARYVYVYATKVWLVRYKW